MRETLENRWEHKTYDLIASLRQFFLLLLLVLLPPVLIFLSLDVPRVKQDVERKYIYTK
jgi:hypothetical protein